MSKKRVYAFYISERSARGRQAIALPGGGRAFVRAVWLRGAASDLEGLDHASPPQEGEVGLMNTHELDVSRT